MQAFGQLRDEALAWEKDALFVMLANVDLGQEGQLLAMALSDPSLSDPTPEGKGRNWVLLAASPGARSVVVLDLGGQKLDLIAQGKVSSGLLDQITKEDTSGQALSDLEPSKLLDSDVLVSKAGEVGAAPGMSMALVAPSRLGLDSLFQGDGGGQLPQVVYEVFAPEPEASVAFFDATTGAQIEAALP